MLGSPGLSTRVGSATDRALALQQRVCDRQPVRCKRQSETSHDQHCLQEKTHQQFPKFESAAHPKACIARIAQKMVCLQATADSIHRTAHLKLDNMFSLKHLKCAITASRCFCSERDKSRISEIAGDAECGTSGEPGGNPCGESDSAGGAGDRSGVCVRSAELREAGDAGGAVAVPGRPVLGLQDVNNRIT